jgi:hypothetical protein
MAIDIAKLHQNLLQELSEIESLLQQELAEDENMALARENNYRFLRLLLEQPELHPRSYARVLFEKHGEVIDTDVQRQLRADRLYSVEQRSRLVDIMESTGNRTHDLIIGQSADGFQDYDNVASIVKSRFFWKRRIEGKLFLITLTLLPSWQEDMKEHVVLQSLLDKLRAIASRGSYKLCREAGRRLVRTLGVEYGFAERETSAERMQGILEDVDTTDLDDMRAALLLAQREAEHWRQEFQEKVDNLNQKFVYDFFGRMNSARYSYLLDTIAQTDALIGELQDKGWAMEPKLQAIPMVIQIFMNVLRAERVFPLETVGATKELSRAELFSYEFVGSKDFGPGDKVAVVVRTPGWKVGDVVISKPRVEEINSSSRINVPSSRGSEKERSEAQ